MTTRDAFGPTLRAQRERRGITIEAIADRTKIGVSLLSALERNDVTRWPRGIFRRAFFREYAIAIGLRPDPLLAEFLRLFPEDGLPDHADAVEPMPLTLALDASAGRRLATRRLVTAVMELSAVVLAGAVAAWLLTAGVWTSSGILALIYYPITRACPVRTPRLRSVSRVIALAPVEWLRRRRSAAAPLGDPSASAPQLGTAN
jgi:transcriptional regulator with XRE-family HTH domain